MNEFTAKKLGEVLAFCTVGIETIQKAGKPFSDMVSDEFVAEYIEKNTVHAEELKALAAIGEKSEVTLTKHERTADKLRKMRELYIGDQWENPVEVLEWLGFFEGAAQVHWALVQGAGKIMESDALIALAAEGEEVHHQFLEKVSTELESVGEERGK
jgi:hypothetical protein